MRTSPTWSMTTQPIVTRASSAYLSDDAYTQKRTRKAPAPSTSARTLPLSAHSLAKSAPSRSSPARHTIAIVATTGTGQASGALISGKTSVTLMVGTSLWGRRARSTTVPFTSEHAAAAGDTPSRHVSAGGVSRRVSGLAPLEPRDEGRVERRHVDRAAAGAQRRRRRRPRRHGLTSRDGRGHRGATVPGETDELRDEQRVCATVAGRVGRRDLDDLVGVVAVGVGAAGPD